MKLVIDRKQWRRGPQTQVIKEYDPTSLLCKDGTKCCLGFYALQCGFQPEQIKGMGDPTEVSVDYNESPKDWEKLVTFYEDDEYGTFSTLSTDLTNGAIDINDSDKLSEEEREKALIKLFATDGIEVEFQ